MLKDQADQYGCDRTAAAVAKVEDEIMAVAGALSRRPRTRKPDGRPVAVYVSSGRWVADCECGAGIDASTWLDWCTCLECGRVYKVDIPKDCDAAVDALCARTDWRTRHWHPHKGETVGQLVTENEVMGGIGVPAKPARTDPPSHIVNVAGLAADGLAVDLEEKLLREGGYVIRDDDAAGVAEVEVRGQSDATVAALKKSLGAEDVPDAERST